MNMQLVFVENDRPVTDSLAVAGRFGKEHKNVMRDISNQIDKLIEADREEFVRLNFERITYRDSLNREHDKYMLTEEAFTVVTMSFTTVDAMRFKVDFLEEFKRMKMQLLNSKFNLPKTFAESLRMLADEMEEKQRLSVENERLAIQTSEQEARLKYQEPRVAFANMVVAAGNTQPMGTVAKAVGMGRNNLFKLLREKGVIMKNSTIPYQNYIDRGYFVVREVPTKRGDDSIVNEPTARVTARGLEYIAKLIRDNQGA